MKKWIALVLVGLIAVLGYAAAGPYLAIHAIGKAVREENASALARHVDFPPLRASLKAQLSDRMVRAAGIEPGTGLLGTLGASIAGTLAGSSVDLMVTPMGLGAMMEGRKVCNRASGLPPPSASDDTWERHDPLRDAERRYESTSRFTATVRTDAGDPVVFVLTRSGLRWKLSDIRLPP